MIDLMNVKLTLAQVIAGISSTFATAIVGLLWMTNTFESKAESIDKYQAVQKQMISIDKKQEKIDQIAIDVAVIKSILSKRRSTND